MKSDKSGKANVKSDADNESKFSVLEGIYFGRNVGGDLSEFLKTANKVSVGLEIDRLEEVVGRGNYGDVLVVFLTEAIAKCGSKRIGKKLEKLVEIVNHVIKDKAGERHMILRIRLLNVLNGLNRGFNGNYNESRNVRFVPICFHLINTINQCLNIKTIDKTSGVKISVDNLKVSENVARTDEFKDFVFKKLMRLLYKHMDTHSNSISFPEYAYFVLKRLKHLRKISKSKIEIFDGMIRKIEDQIELIVKEREIFCSKIDELNNHQIYEFSTRVHRMSDVKIM